MTVMHSLTDDGGGRGGEGDSDPPVLEKLEYVLRRVHPAKAREASRVLRSYGGTSAELFRYVEEEYETLLPSVYDAVYAFYVMFDPSKRHQVEAVLDAWEDSEAQLIDALSTKYDTNFFPTRWPALVRRLAKQQQQQQQQQQQRSLRRTHQQQQQQPAILPRKGGNNLLHPTSSNGTSVSGRTAPVSRTLARSPPRSGGGGGGPDRMPHAVRQQILRMFMTRAPQKLREASDLLCLYEGQDSDKLLSLLRALWERREQQHAVEAAAAVADRSFCHSDADAADDAMLASVFGSSSPNATPSDTPPGRDRTAPYASAKELPPPPPPSHHFRHQPQQQHRWPPHSSQQPPPSQEQPPLAAWPDGPRQERRMSPPRRAPGPAPAPSAGRRGEVRDDPWSGGGGGSGGGASPQLPPPPGEAEGLRRRLEQVEEENRRLKQTLHAAESGPPPQQPQQQQQHVAYAQQHAQHASQQRGVYDDINNIHTQLTPSGLASPDHHQPRHPAYPVVDALHALHGPPPPHADRYLERCIQEADHKIMVARSGRRSPPPLHHHVLQRSVPQAAYPVDVQRYHGSIPSDGLPVARQQQQQQQEKQQPATSTSAPPVSASAAAPSNSYFGPPEPEADATPATVARDPPPSVLLRQAMQEAEAEEAAADAAAAAAAAESRAYYGVYDEAPAEAGSAHSSLNFADVLPQGEEEGAAGAVSFQQGLGEESAAPAPTFQQPFQMLQPASVQSADQHQQQPPPPQQQQQQQQPQSVLSNTPMHASVAVPANPPSTPMRQAPLPTTPMSEHQTQHQSDAPPTFATAPQQAMMRPEQQLLAPAVSLQSMPPPEQSQQQQQHSSVRQQEAVTFGSSHPNVPPPVAPCEVRTPVSTRSAASARSQARSNRHSFQAQPPPPPHQSDALSAKPSAQPSAQQSAQQQSVQLSAQQSVQQQPQLHSADNPPSFQAPAPSADLPAAPQQSRGSLQQPPSQSSRASFKVHTPAEALQQPPRVPSREPSVAGSAVPSQHDAAAALSARPSVQSQRSGGRPSFQAPQPQQSQPQQSVALKVADSQPATPAVTPAAQASAPSKGPSFAAPSFATPSDAAATGGVQQHSAGVAHFGPPDTSDAKPPTRVPSAASSGAHPLRRFSGQAAT